MTWRSGLFGVAFALSVSQSACVDTSPLPFERRSTDAGGDAAPIDGAVLNACRRCVTDADGPCRPDYEVCAADAQCVAFTDCLFEIGCFSLGDLQARIACGKPCFDKTGVSTSGDPALNHALPVNGCTSPGNVCAGVCVAR
jgi:hypothetical protein